MIKDITFASNATQDTTFPATEVVATVALVDVTAASVLTAANRATLGTS